MKSSTERFVSLDVLRGLTVVGMIMVNTQGVGKAFDFLRHSSWNGCRVADLVYPFFLFIVGAAIRFAFQKTNFVLNSIVIKKVLKRGILIFLIGFLLNIFPFTDPPESWRILGVLQRIAIVYVLATFLILWLKTPKKIIWVTISILLFYWLLMAGLGYTLEDNIVLKVDRFFLGESHLYTGYGIYFDPEGLVSSIPSIANALIGYLTSVWLIEERMHREIPYRILFIGIGLIAVSLLWNLIFPFNKPIWSSSFVLYSSGWAMLIWFVLFWLIDVKKQSKWTGFFLVFGTNALFSYILSELLLILNYKLSFMFKGQTYYISTWLDHYFYSVLTTTPVRSALWGITMVAVCLIITYQLYKRRIYIKL